LSDGGEAVTAEVPLEVADDPCAVTLSATGNLARYALNSQAGNSQAASAERPWLSVSGDGSPDGGGEAGAAREERIITSAVRTTARAEIGAVTTAGRLIKVNVIEIPLTGEHPLSEFLTLDDDDETVLALTTLDENGGVALGTASGVVKRVVPDYPNNRDDFELITLKEGDRVIGAVQLTGDETTIGETDLVFVTSDAQLLRFGASTVRPQGRAAGGMAGIRLGQDATILSFAAVGPAAEPVVPGDPVLVTAAGRSDALPGTGAISLKVTPFAEYPAKGRATGGVRCQRFLKGEDLLVLAWIGPGPVFGMTESGIELDLSEMTGKRDGSGTQITRPLAYVGTRRGLGARREIVRPPGDDEGEGGRGADR
jgi:DNA gyrase subunit A